jgi:recombination associated protein RdgC
MLFRNLCVYRLPADWTITAAGLEEKLESRPLNPCAPFEMKSRGWEPVMDTRRRVVTVENQHLVAFGMEQKLLPGSVIRQELERRIKELAEEQGYPAGRKQKRDLRIIVTEELRAKALVAHRINLVWIDPVNHWVVVDTGSFSRAEEVLTVLRDTLGSFPATLLNTEHTPYHVMRSWLVAGDASSNFRIDDDLELRAVDGSGAKIRYSKHAFDLKEVRSHLGNGFVPASMELTWNGRISLVLTEKLLLKRVKFLGVEKDDAEEAGESKDGIDPVEKLSAEFLLMAGELSKLFADLVGALGGEAPAEQIASKVAAVA